MTHALYHNVCAVYMLTPTGQHASDMWGRHAWFARGPALHMPTWLHPQARQ
jgi:hypothetical protein